MQVIVKLTTRCNLKCSYCSEGDKAPKTLNMQVLKKLIDEIPEVLNKYKQKDITFLWHGGEPLLVGKNYLAEAMQYALQNLSNYKVRFSVQTNGTLIDEEWIGIFKRFDVGVGVSLDGYKEIHDLNRKGKDDTPTFDKILSNILLLQTNDISVGTLMVLNSIGDIDLKKLWNLISSKHLNVKIHPVIPCGRAKNNNQEKQIYDNYINLLEEIYKLCINENEIIEIEPLNEILQAILKIAPMRECSFNGTCGQNFICLYSDGAVGFCGRINDDKKFVYGYLQESPLINLYESGYANKVRDRQRFLMENNCKDCIYWDLCHGGCAFEALNAYGTIYAKYPNCEGRKKLLKFLQTEGLVLLKQRLIKEKQYYRNAISEKKNLLKELKNAQK